VELEESQKKEVIELLEALDDDEDVSAVYCNAALGDIDEIV
jgi:transcriptional/translational regulatory protein YebC/TACO1